MGCTASKAINSATVTTPADPDPNNNTSTPPTQTDIRRLTDLGVIGSVGAPTVSAGSNAVYTFAITNGGPSAAAEPDGVFTFPPGFELVGIDVPHDFVDCHSSVAGTPAQVTVTCEAIDAGAKTPDGKIAPPGMAVSAIITMKTPDDLVPGFYTADGSVMTITDETDYTNNTTAVPVTVLAVADTQIVKTLLTNPVVAGRPVTFRLVATNAGPSAAPATVISDIVPEGLTFRSSRLGSGGAASCLIPVRSGDDVATVDCLMGTLEPGQSVTVDLTFDTDKALTGTLANTGIVGSAALDPDYSNNQDDDSGPIIVPPPTDVAVMVSPASQVVAKGEVVTWTVTVTNNGPEQAVGARLTLTLPERLDGVSITLVSASTPVSPACQASEATLVCDLGDLAVSDQIVWTLSGTAAGESGSEGIVEAAVDHQEVDSNPANDTARARYSTYTIPPTVSPAPSLDQGSPPPDPTAPPNSASGSPSPPTSPAAPPTSAPASPAPPGTTPPGAPPTTAPPTSPPTSAPADSPTSPAPTTSTPPSARPTTTATPSHPGDALGVGTGASRETVGLVIAAWLLAGLGLGLFGWRRRRLAVGPEVQSARHQRP
jgi:uncharacterized repeat protein (TIGR01451 family)